MTSGLKSLRALIFQGDSESFRRDNDHQLAFCIHYRRVNIGILFTLCSRRRKGFIEVFTAVFMTIGLFYLVGKDRC